MGKGVKLVQCNQWIFYHMATVASVFGAKVPPRTVLYVFVDTHTTHLEQHLLPLLRNSATVLLDQFRPSPVWDTRETPKSQNNKTNWKARRGVFYDLCLIYCWLEFLIIGWVRYYLFRARSPHICFLVIHMTFNCCGPNINGDNVALLAEAVTSSHHFLMQVSRRHVRWLWNYSTANLKQNLGKRWPPAKNVNHAVCRM